MDKTVTASLIHKKITEGKTILAELNRMRKRQGPAINVTYYAQEDVDKCRNMINTWQLTSSEILINGFGETHRFVNSFNKTITPKDSGFNFKREFEIEVNSGVSVLEGVCEVLSYGIQEQEELEDANAKDNKNARKIFISHSSKDADLMAQLQITVGGRGREGLAPSIPGELLAHRWKEIKFAACHKRCNFTPLKQQVHGSRNHSRRS